MWMERELLPIGYDRASDGTTNKLLDQRARSRDLSGQNLRGLSRPRLRPRARTPARWPMASVQRSMTISSPVRDQPGWCMPSAGAPCSTSCATGSIAVRLSHKDKVHPGPSSRPSSMQGAVRRSPGDASTSQTRRTGEPECRKPPHSLLTGKHRSMRDGEADVSRLQPMGVGGRLYRYYVSAPLQQGGKRSQRRRSAMSAPDRCRHRSKHFVAEKPLGSSLLASHGQDTPLTVDESRLDAIDRHPSADRGISLQDHS